MTHPIIKGHLSVIANYLFSSITLLEQVEELEAQELAAELRLLHVGLDLAYSALENGAIADLITGEDRPF
ncbi:MAG TPA: hypothetical protein V6D19_00130 [Stenomitos sp.]